MLFKEINIFHMAFYLLSYIYSYKHATIKKISFLIVHFNLQ